ncbi:MAG: T9SS type A sorting domain-containing protein [Sphingomonadales bacterium]|nr:T9SS type A sorting domain-containing protein [Sphingomonadales bacterium]
MKKAVRTVDKIKYFMVILTFPTLLFGQAEHLVQPNTADPLSGAPNNFHFIYTNQNVTQKNKLFLFFPGTGAVPFNYREILKHAANIGYHSIGLTYPNSNAINQICLTTTDTTCHSRARLEVFDGTDRHSDVNVDVNNCIERRTLKLLMYLNTNYPTENWGQFFSGNQIFWGKVIVSGHSQGGGFAGIISKIKQVERVAMFAAMDWISLLNRPADWITWNGQTPDHKYYGFTHQNDEAVDFNKIQTTWANYGMNSFGNIVLVDASSAPYNNSHQLYTLLTPANDPDKFHNAVVVDAHTPFTGNLPVYAPVWAYMIEDNETSNTGNEIILGTNILIYPNPSASFLYIVGIVCPNSDFKIFSSQGQLIETGKLNDSKIDLSHLVKGIYMIQFHQGNILRTLKLLKE